MYPAVRIERGVKTFFAKTPFTTRLRFGTKAIKTHNVNEWTGDLLGIE